MPVDLLRLRTFVAVAEEQHLTRAAERLNVSQSAASAHVRAVEASLGSQLLICTNRRLELTRAGQLLLQKAKNFFNEEALFASFVRELRGKLVVSTGNDPDTRSKRSVEVLLDYDTSVESAARILYAVVLGAVDVQQITVCYAKWDLRLRTGHRTKNQNTRLSKVF